MAGEENIWCLVSHVIPAAAQGIEPGQRPQYRATVTLSQRLRRTTRQRSCFDGHAPADSGARHSASTRRGATDYFLWYVTYHTLSLLRIALVWALRRLAPGSRLPRRRLTRPVGEESLGPLRRAHFLENLHNPLIILPISYYPRKKPAIEVLSSAY